VVVLPVNINLKFIYLLKEIIIMKKLLLALGLAASIGFAQAQSSVTVYGYLDTGYVGTNYHGAGTNASNQQTTSAIGASIEGPSRLGFMGSEDLGGGTSAIFKIETGLNPSNATLSSFNNRQTYAGLKQSGLGEVRLGTQMTPIFFNALKTDAGALNNIAGDAIWAGNPQGPTGNSGATPYAAPSSNGSQSDGFTVRTTNTITAMSDNFAGFTATGFVTLNDVNTTQTSPTTGGIVNNNGYGLSLNYEWNKLFMTANYMALKSYTSAATLTSPTPGIWAAAGGGSNTQDNQTYLAGTYDFGILKAYAQYINRRVTDTLNSSYFGNRSGEQIGVKGFVTPHIETWAQVGTGKVTAFGQGNPTANFTTYQIGSNYWLSKRTNLFAIYGGSQTSNLASVNIPGVSGNAFGLGIAHTF
jgi:predicted porin